MNRYGKSLLIAVSCGLAALLTGCGKPADVAAPTTFAKYNAKNGDFALEYPDGWEAKGGGKKNHSLKVTKGAVIIEVRSDLTGSLIGDIAGNSVGVMPGGMPDGEFDAELDLAPVAQVHQMAQEEMAELIGSYSEGKAEKVSTAGFGEGRMSEFTGKQGLGVEIKGMRATVLGRDKRVVVVCTCPPSNWDALKPAFKKVIESLKYGQAEI
jgi:hypothetical protein